MKNRFFSYTLMILSVSSFFGCATQPQRVAQTNSRNPEVVIKGVDVETVRARIIERLMSGGMRLDSETPSRIVVSQEVEGINENLLRLSLGNANSTPVRVELAFTIVKVSEGVKVFCQRSAWTQMPGGQINRVELNGNQDFNDGQTALYNLRDSL